MKTFYKIFLIIFILFTGFNLYLFKWNLGIMHEENSKFLLSISAGIIGIILVFVLDAWSKIAMKKK
ncbi:MAG: hypothetical protein LBE36_12010 [Flavobacteriaceae bacterium]|nr:hypothetical protein [Flavobacteriaceae bacterium]